MCGGAVKQSDLSTQLVLVDQHDVQVGVANKLRAHRQGLLHRACSVFVFDGKGRLLLQRRADEKYHSGGLWSNTCCGHPTPGETPIVAAHRRLGEEMGFDCCLDWCGVFVYRAPVGGGLIEHEYDHLFVGRAGADPRPDPREVSAWRWASIPRLCHDLAGRPNVYTAWMRGALYSVLDMLAAHHPPADEGRRVRVRTSDKTTRRVRSMPSGSTRSRLPSDE
jgi:isopentenyl-diphosphate delta-isomerase